MQIVDTISSSNINYDKSEVDSFYASVPIDDLELLIGPKLARSRPNSPTNELNKSNTQNMGNLFTLYIFKNTMVVCKLKYIFI